MNGTRNEGMKECEKADDTENLFTCENKYIYISFISHDRYMFLFSFAILCDIVSSSIHIHDTLCVKRNFFSFL
jgi:hypothetical protein